MRVTKYMVRAETPERPIVGHTERCPAGDSGCWHAYNAAGDFIGRDSTRRDAASIVLRAAERGTK